MMSETEIESFEVETPYPDATAPEAQEPDGGADASGAADSGGGADEGYKRPEKFKTEAALYEAYRQLEAKLGAAPKQESQPDPKPSEPEGSAPSLFTAEQQAQFRQELLGGGLTDESKAALAARGVTPEMASMYLYGQQAMEANALENWIKEQGGQETFSEAHRWGKENWSPSEFMAWEDRLRAAREAQDYAGMRRHLDLLYTHYNADRDTYPSTSVRGASPGRVQPFQSQGEMIAAMNDPRYDRGDTAYHNEFKRRLAVSPNF